MNSATLKRKFWLSAVFACLLLLFTLVYSHKTYAVSWYLPDKDKMSSDANVHLEIAQGGSEITLDADSTWVKLYFDAGVSNKLAITMADAKFECDSPRNNGDPNYGGYYWLDSQGLNNDCTDPGAVDYDFYCSDAGGNSPDYGRMLRPTLNSNDPKINLSIGPGYHPVFDTPNITSPCDIINGRYVIYVRAGWSPGSAVPGVGRINGFKVAAPITGALASYWAGNANNYAVQNRVDQMPGEDSYMNFEFAPPCDLNPDPQLASLVWKDADATSDGGSPKDGTSGGFPGAFSGDNEPSFDLLEGDANGAGGTNWQTVAHVDSGGTTVGAGYSLGITPDNIGGDGQTKQLQFTAKRSKVYSWKWYNMNWDNGVQLQVPFDSYYAAKTACPPPPGGGGTGAVQGRVFKDTVITNGVWDSGEAIIEDPSAGCSGSPRQALGSVGISVSGGGSGTPSNCAPDGGVGSGTFGYYKFPAPTGTPSVSISVPSGWVPTTPTSYTVTVNDGVDTNVPWFGIKPGQGVEGRVFIDDNNNGLFDPAIDKIVKNPSGACTGPNVYVGGTSVTALSNGATSVLDRCNGPFAAKLTGPGTYAFWQVSTPTGSQTVRLNLPTDWVANPKGTTRTYTVPDTGFGGPTTEDDYFGMLPRAPDVTAICRFGKSMAQISWPSAGLGSSNYWVDISSSNTFSSYSNKLVSGNNIPDAPVGFGGPINTELTPGNQYYVRIYYNGANVHSAVMGPFTAKGCPKLTCGSLTTTPSQPEDGTAFIMKVSFNNVGKGPLQNGPSKLHVTFPGSPSAYYDQDTPYSPSPLGAPGTAISNDINLTVPKGLYTVTWTVTGDTEANQLTDPNTPGTCKADVSVAAKPYFRTFGGDVIAGSYTGCTTWLPHASSAGGILGFNKGNGDGAGTQLVAQALATINGFSTAQTTNPTANKGLTFANSSAGTYGGDFRQGSCPPDYFANRAAPTGGLLPLLYVPLLTPSGIYYSATPLLASPILGGTIGKGKSIVIYVNGDVYITNNIVYDNGAGVPGYWATPEDIPSFVLVAKGNITIAPSVTKLEGVYIAQPVDATTGGTVYTCDSVLPKLTLNLISNQCNNNLTIVGSVLARNIKLQRTGGTLREAVANNCPADMPGIYGCSGVSTAAEQFIYSPQVWLRSNNIIGVQKSSNFDVITGLSPIL